VPFLDHHAVRRGIFAVIGQEDDDGVVGLARFLQRFSTAAMWVSTTAWSQP
jgi:hypothetical protein